MYPFLSVSLDFYVNYRHYKTDGWGTANKLFFSKATHC